MPESVHPKASGYLAVTDAILTWTKTVASVTPRVSDGVITDNLGEMRPPVEITWPPTFDPQKQVDDLLLTRGAAVAPEGGGYAAGSPVTFTLHSDPLVLGTLTADENGDIEGTLLIPGNAAIGQHHIVVSGINEDGTYFERELAVTVSEPTPFWVWAALIGAMPALLGGVTIAIIGFMKRRRELAVRVA